MEAIPKCDIKSHIKSDIRFDIIIQQTTWTGHIYFQQMVVLSFCCKGKPNGYDF